MKVLNFKKVTLKQGLDPTFHDKDVRTQK